MFKHIKSNCGDLEDKMKLGIVILKKEKAEIEL